MSNFTRDTALDLPSNSREVERQNSTASKCDDLASFLAAPKSIYEGKTKEYKGPKEST